MTAAERYLEVPEGERTHCLPDDMSNPGKLSIILQYKTSLATRLALGGRPEAQGHHCLPMHRCAEGGYRVGPAPEGGQTFELHLYRALSTEYQPPGPTTSVQDAQRATIRVIVRALGFINPTDARHLHDLQARVERSVQDKFSSALKARGRVAINQARSGGGIDSVLMVFACPRDAFPRAFPAAGLTSLYVLASGRVIEREISPMPTVQSTMRQFSIVGRHACGGLLELEHEGMPRMCLRNGRPPRHMDPAAPGPDTYGLEEHYLGIPLRGTARRPPTRGARHHRPPRR